MQLNPAKPLLFQRLVSWLLVKAKENRIPLTAALVFGCLAHTFAFTNKLINHDEAQCLFSKGATVVSGRWGLGALDSVFPNVSMPWIYGVITLGLFAVSVCVIVRILCLQSSWTQVLAAGFVLTFPSLTGTFGYLFTASSYGVAFLLAVVSVWLLRQEKGRMRVLGVGCMVLSLSIYQAYVSVMAALLILALIRDLLEGEEASQVFRRGMAYVLFLTLGLLLYFGATQIILRLKHVQMVSYASDSLSLQPGSLPEKVLLAYQTFLRYFREGAMGLIPTRLSRRVHLLLLGLIGLLLLLCVVRKQCRPLSLLLILVLVGLLPLAINCMFLITTEDAVHTLVVYSFVSVYLLALLLAERCLPFPAGWAELCRRSVLNVLAAVSAVILITNTYIANEAYLTLQLRYENAYAFYTSLIADIKLSPDFKEGTRLAVIGTWDDPDFYEEHLEFTNHLTGVTGFKPDSYSRERFLRQYIGFSIPFASDAEMEAIQVSSEFAEMAVYPYYGSMRKIGDILVVKLS